MKKIKKFKINLRLREVARLLKATTQIRDITPQMEEAIQREMRRLSGVITPAAEYESQPKEKLALGLIGDAPQGTIAASLFVVTIGSTIEDELRDAQQRGETMLEQMLHCIAVEALEQSNNFVYRLLLDEAKDEACELSRRRLQVTREVWENVTAILPGDKIGVALVDSDSLQPRYSSVSVAYWLPAKKKK